MMESIIALALFAIGIAVIVSYGIGYDNALGKPKTEAHMRPGTRYASGYGFIEVDADGTRRRVALLHNLDEGRAEYCILREPLPAMQLVVVAENGGGIRLQPAPEVHIDTTA